MIRGAVVHSDRGTQYTSEIYRKAIHKYGIVQSMNSAGGRCHDNARCESMWTRLKEELLYGRYDTTTMTVEQLKTLIWRYFIGDWNNRRIVLLMVVYRLWLNGSNTMPPNRKPHKVEHA